QKPRGLARMIFTVAVALAGPSWASGATLLRLGEGRRAEPFRGRGPVPDYNRRAGSPSTGAGETPTPPAGRAGGGVDESPERGAGSVLDLHAALVRLDVVLAVLLGDGAGDGALGGVGADLLVVLLLGALVVEDVDDLLVAFLDLDGVLAGALDDL